MDEMVDEVKDLEVVYMVRGEIAPSRSHIKCVMRLDKVREYLNSKLAQQHKSVLRITSVVALTSSGATT